MYIIHKHNRIRYKGRRKKNKIKEENDDTDPTAGKRRLLSYRHKKNLKVARQNRHGAPTIFYIYRGLYYVSIYTVVILCACIYIFRQKGMDDRDFFEAIKYTYNTVYTNITSVKIKIKRQKR